MKKALLRIYTKVASILPKKKMILFESYMDFTDSAWKLYQTCLEEHLNQNYKLVWFVENIENYKNNKEKECHFYRTISKDLANQIIQKNIFLDIGDKS